MIYFSDVDVVLKLARCGFLPYLPELLGATQDTICIQYLASLKARLTRPNKMLNFSQVKIGAADFLFTFDPDF